MSLRTPNPFQSRQSSIDLQRSKERLAILQEQIASGKRIVRLGDDPTGAALILDFQTSIDRNDAYVQQVSNARSFLKASESAVESLTTDVTRLVELCEQGLSDTSGASGRSRISEEVDSLRSNLISTGNTQEQGKYLFAGTRTLTQPFSGPSAGPITYAGDGNDITLDVSIGNAVTTNVTGDDLFLGSGGQGSSTDLFQQVTDLRDALAANDTAGIQTAYTNLKGVLERLSNVATEIGGRENALQQTEDALESYNLSLKAVQKTYQAVDYPTAIQEANTELTAQKATMWTMANANQASLFDYLG